MFNLLNPNVTQDLMLHHELLDDNEAHVESGAEASRNQAAVIGDSPSGDTNTIPSRDLRILLVKKIAALK